MAEKKLFLLDAMALIYRAHFAFIKNPRVTRSGLNTSAIFGFANTLLDVLQNEQPTHIGVAFDTSAPTFRHTSFEAYKANRQEQPEDIAVAIPYVKRLVEAFDIPLLELDGYEADDVIGTLATHAAADGFRVYMMTPDKDYCQLVSDQIFVYKPSYQQKPVEILGVKEVLERWEVQHPDQVRDILGLMGDAVDNIPGIPGVGEKTAKKLIAEYGTVENLIANAGGIKGKMGENIRAFAAQGLQSKELATIMRDVPLPYEVDRLCCSELHKEQIRALFEELEFRTMARRVLGEELSSAPATPGAAAASKKAADPSQMNLFGAPEPASGGAFTEENAGESAVAATPFRTIYGTAHRYELVQEPEELDLLAELLNRRPIFCFDTETAALDPCSAVVGLAFSFIEGEAYYIPLPKDQAQAKAIIERFRQPLENPASTKVGQNLKYDLAVLRNQGIEVGGPLFDTMIAHYLLEADQRHNMDDMAKAYLHYQPISITELIGKKARGAQGSMADVPVADVAEYAGEDADITWQLYKTFAPMLKDRGVDKVFHEIEVPLVRVLHDMEHEGVRIDTAALKDLSRGLADDLALVEQQVWQAAGEQFNVSSPAQLGRILFEKLKLDPKAKKTKTGQYATGEEVLSKMADMHPIAGLILDYRELLKLKNTYIDALPELINPRTGRVHTSFNQTVAATGRLSSTNPNLQNIPIRTARGREIRKAFVPRDSDHLLLSADYSQIELRIMAAFSQDETMLQAFAHNADIHSITASKLYHVPLEAVTSDMRRAAKTANFGIIYGISAFGLSQRLNIPRKEAAEIIDNYFLEFPRIKQYMDDVIRQARENEYVTTLLGRRRYLSLINSRNQTERGFAERNAINAPIQGTAADLIKIAMVNIHEWMQQEKLKSRMVLQVHDELVFEAHLSEVDLLKEKVPYYMSQAIDLGVPLEVGVGVGSNWLEAH